MESTDKVGDPLPFEHPSWFEHAEQRERERFSNPTTSLGNLFGSHCQVGVVKPTGFDEGAQAVGEHFRRRQAVKAIILNLQGTDAELAKRMVDFCAGLVYALDGVVHPIANSFFLLAPAEVEVLSKAGSRTTGSEFYNQS